MNNGLEALKRNRNFIERYFVKQVEETGVYHKDMKDEIFNDLSIIEKELKEGESLRKAYNELIDTYNKDISSQNEEIIRLRKKEQALEIVKKYFWLEDFQDFIAFNGRLPKSLKEECGFLKDVLQDSSTTKKKEQSDFSKESAKYGYIDAQQMIEIGERIELMPKEEATAFLDDLLKGGLL